MFKYVGKTVLFEYPNGSTIKIRYISDNRMVWESLKTAKLTASMSEEETFYYKEVRPDNYLISWVENNGVVVTQFADFKQCQVTSCMTWNDPSLTGGRGITLGKGTLKLIS